MVLDSVRCPVICILSQFFQQLYSHTCGARAASHVKNVTLGTSEKQRKIDAIFRSNTATAAAVMYELLSGALMNYQQAYSPEMIADEERFKFNAKRPRRLFASMGVKIRLQ